MQIHPVFHKKLLEPAPPDAELATDIELKDDEYEVEEIKDLRKISNQPLVQIAMVRQQEDQYQRPSSPQPALLRDPTLSALPNHGEHTNTPTPQPLEAQ
ncbi:hypothetical protein COCHEDRAFT_1063208, partial [Bipolaris maydis C5]